MLPGRLDIFNGHKHRGRLAPHWSRQLVLEVSENFYWLDPAGLRGFGGLPTNEYEPEALRVVVACCCGGTANGEAFWCLDEEEGRRLMQAVNAEQLQEILRHVFTEAFGAWASNFEWRLPAKEILALLHSA